MDNVLKTRVDYCNAIRQKLKTESRIRSDEIYNNELVRIIEGLAEIKLEYTGYHLVDDYEDD